MSKLQKIFDKSSDASDKLYESACFDEFKPYAGRGKWWGNLSATNIGRVGKILLQIPVIGVNKGTELTAKAARRPLDTSKKLKIFL